MTPLESGNAAASSRRDFLATASGLVIFFHGSFAKGQEPARPPRSRGLPYPTDFNAYLRVAADGSVTCFAGKVEMGQGPSTMLAQLLADEMDVSFDAVDVVLGDTDLCPWDLGTFGSMTTPYLGPVIREAGAEARAVLLQLAAEKLGAPVERLTVKNGLVTDPVQGKSVSYGDLVQGRRIERHIEKTSIKPVSALKIMGHSQHRKDATAKVTGKTLYSGDIILPGMLHARILRPPAHGAKLLSVDTSAVAKSGARLVRDGDLIAVLHEHRELADKALQTIKAEWQRPTGGPDDKTIFEHLVKTAPPMKQIDAAGDLKTGEQLAKTLLEETYLNAYVAHAPIEPHCATAQFDGTKLTVWASNQAPFALRDEVAAALKLKPASVRIIASYLGGGFGGKTPGPQALEAARLAVAVGKPVQVVWDRAEEFYYDTFRPAAVVKIRSGLDAGGKLTLWDYSTYAGGEREARSFYDAPNHRTQFAGSWSGGNPEGFHPFAVGAWRAPSSNTNTFAREVHMDILAEKLHADPVEFRLRNLTEPRIKRVLETAAQKFGYEPGARGVDGRGVGVSCGTDAGGFSAAVAQVLVDRATGKVRVERVVCAVDHGLTINPDGSRQQMEGSVMMGLGYALAEEVRFAKGEVLDKNFDTYSIPLFSWLPKIETVLIENPDTPSAGCGEVAIINMGAVICNAIFNATGARLKQLPMTPARVLAALKSV